MSKENDEILIDLREVFGILKKRVLMIVGIAVVFLAVAVAYTTLREKPPMYYESTASVETSVVAREIFRSRSVVEPVIEKFLSEDGKALPSYENWMGTKFKYIEPKNRATVHQHGQTEFLMLTITDTSPKRAQSMLEEIISLSNQRLLEIKKEQLTEATTPVGDVGNKSAIEQIEPVLFQNMMFIVIDKPSLAKEPMPPQEQGRAKICAMALVLGIIVGSISAVVKEKF